MFDNENLLTTILFWVTTVIWGVVQGLRLDAMHWHRKLLRGNEAFSEDFRHFMSTEEYQAAER